MSARLKRCHREDAGVALFQLGAACGLSLPTELKVRQECYYTTFTNQLHFFINFIKRRFAKAGNVQLLTQRSGFISPVFCLHWKKSSHAPMLVA